MEFDFLLPENNKKKLSLKQNIYRNSNEVEDKTRMEHFLCLRQDPPDSLAFRPFPGFTIADRNMLLQKMLSESHLVYKHIPVESNPSTQYARDKMKEREEENNILVDNMMRNWDIISELPFTSGTSGPIDYSSNIDVESRLRNTDHRATSLDTNRNYSTQIKNYETLFNENTNPYVSGGVREVNNAFNQTSVGFIGGRELFGESTKRKTILE